MKVFSDKGFERFSVLRRTQILMLVLSLMTRLVLMCWSWSASQLSWSQILPILCKGALYDLCTVLYFTLLGILYFSFVPQKMFGSKIDRILVWTGCFLSLFIFTFSIFAEFTFWDEFKSRFNFIAVDYLIYTFEVIQNINQSYPLPLLIAGMLVATLVELWIVARGKTFSRTFTKETSFKKQLTYFLSGSLLVLLSLFLLNNTWANKGTNRYGDELSKNGIYSFFAAYRSNELAYPVFYDTLSNTVALQKVQQSFPDSTNRFLTHSDLSRMVLNQNKTVRPNVILFTIESFSASFMHHFGDDKGLTPFLDSLADQGILFDSLFATGTRTVRGMEALTLSVPPTPGNSIVRREDNAGLFNIGSVFAQKGYSRTFFYGGDGYFDNMNNFFSGNGFDIVDKGSRVMVGDELATKRTIIPDRYVHFKTAWGVCDEDIYDVVSDYADEQTAKGKPFFDFIMTTSNHRPFTYPAGKVDLPSGSGRDGAVKYTDYAIRQFFKKSIHKSWFKNTIFVFVADHCANSAGKDAVDVSKYHIPCIVYNPALLPSMKINKLCSQIDIFPTLFHLLGWNYRSKLWGQNVLDPQYQPRAFPASYQYLGYMTPGKMLLLQPQHQVSYFDVAPDLSQKISNSSNAFSNQLQMAIANYQSAYNLYKTGKMKQ